MSMTRSTTKLDVIWLVAALALCAPSYLRAQQDGGMLCGGEDAVPRWVFRFEILDWDSHTPVAGARITLTNERGSELSWRVDRNGVGVLVVSDPNCISGIVEWEVAHPQYAFANGELDRRQLMRAEGSRQFALDNQQYDWSDLRRFPSTQEVVDGVRYGRYRYRRFAGGQGPDLYEYEFEMERLGRGRRSGDRVVGAPTDAPGRGTGGIASLEVDGYRISVFPNDLSGGGYHWRAAVSGCASLSRLGFDDWYLPTREELDTIYRNRAAIPGLTPGSYWSSSETSSGGRAWVLSFPDGVQDIESISTQYSVSTGAMHVRCVRRIR